jgi:hypothetical protein
VVLFQNKAASEASPSGSRIPSSQNALRWGREGANGAVAVFGERYMKKLAAEHHCSPSSLVVVVVVVVVIPTKSTRNSSPFLLVNAARLSPTNFACLLACFLCWAGSFPPNGESGAPCSIDQRIPSNQLLATST